MNDNTPSWIAAVAAVIAIGSKFTHNALISVVISGVVIILMSTICVLGHIFHVQQMYTWFGDPPGMASETGVIFIIIGAGKITMASKLSQLSKRR